MNLHEHQAKALFGKSGIPVPSGKVATTVDEAVAFAQEIGLPVVIKAQVLTGGRGKAGGVKVAKTLDDVRLHAGNILGMVIKELPVQKVLIDPASNIAQEIYLAIAMDRAASRPVLISSSEGGVEIEQVAHDKPEAIIREHIDPQLGLHDYQTRSVAGAINLPREHWRAFSEIALRLYNCYVQNDATLTEVNPLVVTKEGVLIALDGKMVIDDNALYRHKDIATMRDLSAEAESETQARLAGIAYVKLNGQIGCMVNGAGLAMTTMDMVKLYGGDGIAPANFLDIGGGAQADKVVAALRIILSDSNVKAVLINIFGGITRADEVARGMIQAYNEVKPSVPIIIRLVGTNAEEGRKIIEEANIPHLLGAATLTEAAQKAVEAAKGAN